MRNNARTAGHFFCRYQKKFKNGIMKHLLLLLLIFVILTLITKSSYPQTNVKEQWVSRYNRPGCSWDFSIASITDDNQNTYVSGKFWNGINFDFLTIKYDPSGLEEWSKLYNGPANRRDEAFAIAIDNLGNIYVTGASEGDRENDIATIKYSSTGVQEWVNRFDGPANGKDIAKAIALDDHGNIFVTGGSQGENSGYDYILIKYSPQGIQQWTTRFNGIGNSDDIAEGVIVDKSFNCYVTGSSVGNGTGKQKQDYATIKFDSAGVEQWAATYNGPGNGLDKVSCIILDTHGNVYISGSSKGIDSGDDYATLKYNTNGVEQWIARYDGENYTDQAKSLGLDQFGNIYVTGVSVGKNSGSDYATIKYNSMGLEDWVVRYNGNANGNDGASDLVVDKVGNIYVTGTCSNIASHEIDFNARCCSDYVTIKYDQMGVQEWINLFNGPDDAMNLARYISMDSAGNLYVTGFSSKTSNSNTINWEYLVVKYSQ